MSRVVNDIYAGVPVRILTFPTILFLIIHPVFLSCASRSENRSVEMEQLLGQEMMEGRVVEGSIESPGESGEDSRIGPLGFRVQVIASTIREEVEGVSEVVKGLFPLQVYIEYYEPFFKIRMGNFETRIDAENVRAKLVEYGFDDAWIVETTIEIE